MRRKIRRQTVSIGLLTVRMNATIEFSPTLHLPVLAARRRYLQISRLLSVRCNVFGLSDVSDIEMFLTDSCLDVKRMTVTNDKDWPYGRATLSVSATDYCDIILSFCRRFCLYQLDNRSMFFLAFKSINPESFCSPSGFIDFMSRNSFPYSIETDSENDFFFSESVFFKRRSISSIQQIPCRNKVLSLFP